MLTEMYYKQECLKSFLFFANLARILDKSIILFARDTHSFHSVLCGQIGAQRTPVLHKVDEGKFKI
jgi:hypothetical protein